MKVSARIEKLSPIANPDGSPVIRNGRVRSHRLILLSSSTMESAHAEALALERADGLQKSFALKRDDGKFAMDLTPQQVALLLDNKLPASAFSIVADQCTFNATVELRSPGDVYIDRVTKKEEEIGENGFAQVQDMKATIPATFVQRAFDRALDASFATPHVAISAVPVPAPVAEVVKDSAGHDDTDEQIAPPAPKADNRRRAGTTVKA